MNWAWQTVLAVLGVQCAAFDDRWNAFSQPGWQHGDRPREDISIVVLLALKQRNLKLLEKTAEAVSDPESKEYGRHLQRDELYGIGGSSAYDAAIVEDFFAKQPEGNFKFSFGKDFARYSCSISCVERVFNTSLRIQAGKVSPGSTPVRAATPVSLPAHVQSALEGTSLNAPLFMPPHPEQPQEHAFHYSSSGRTAPRVRPQMIAGDQFISLRFVAYCKDELVNEDALETGICKNSLHSILITAFDILVLQTETNLQKLVRVPAVPDTLGQRLRKTKDGKPCMEFNSTLSSIQNYAGTIVRIRSLFSDGSVSDFSDAGEVMQVFPMAYSTPELLSRNYGIPMREPVRHPRNTVSVAEFLGQYYNPDDLVAFFKLMGVQLWETRDKLQIIGANLPMAGSVLGGEAQLDIQYITALASNVSTIFWSVPSIELATRQEPFLEWLMQLEDTPDDQIPLVHSVSYSDDAYAMPFWFKRRVNDEFMKLALRGITVLVASGDDGVSGAIVSKYGAKYCGVAREGFPSSSPWVTSVGGTQLAQANVPVCGYSSDTVIVSCPSDGEVACTSDRGGGITTGGGFSNDFPRPWYQEAAVHQYVGQTDKPLPSQKDLIYNSSGRAYPDLAGLSSNYLVLMGSDLQAMSGTSASTPLIASMVARWNEDRLQNNLPPLGFINPVIYNILKNHPSAFNDVQMGDNRCFRSACCPVGFSAARGWDAVSGAGSPNFQAIREILQQEAMFAFAPRFSRPAPPLTLNASVQGWWHLPLLLLLQSLATGFVVFMVMSCRSSKLPQVRRPLLDG
ncbi:unnamed protein product [Effrenium voratum]|nr:unnamed protein product [Effrenium voratum]